MMMRLDLSTVAELAVARSELVVYSWRCSGKQRRLSGWDRV